MAAPVHSGNGLLRLLRWMEPRRGGMELTAWCLAPLVPIRSLPLRTTISRAVSLTIWDCCSISSLT
ncbi:uncharacterized protein BO87DRAFT_375921 [Aspergillus neoniger CBS 115656]|uniref:Uncharacterized protein n=1 Tax=Aspergillus neoniger (strain CBS 115656) TaxID=1448310 RepID=A0A318YL65_ASPNB|nr:hypothetical protein BO87DRAFT_375921 [Aspergillus neoniger CBS 115656]PYH35149.1 hypothetical protein BO87DRAFT_375921 [Aspergillus neoniger CBS 115656]